MGHGKVIIMDMWVMMGSIIGMALKYRISIDKNKFDENTMTK